MTAADRSRGPRRWFWRRPRRRGRLAANAPAADAGSAIVEFILVSTLLLILFLGIVQLGLVLHVRNTLAANAAEGARHGANFGVDPAEGGPYAQRLIAEAVPGRADASCTGREIAGDGDIPLVEVTCQVRIPLALVPFGGGVTVTVTGHAVKETQ
ncbi:MAG: pilus assembly protein [Frankia sp.]|nr:pilus assembly protein [Frankia sp.]